VADSNLQSYIFDRVAIANREVAVRGATLERRLRRQEPHGKKSAHDAPRFPTGLKTTVYWMAWWQEQPEPASGCTTTPPAGMILMKPPGRSPVNEPAPPPTTSRDSGATWNLQINRPSSAPRQ
jgi:hypothetical protein